MKTKTLHTSQIISLILLCFFFLSCAQEVKKTEEDYFKVFKISKGINISHWLSQSKKRGKERIDWFTKKDVQYIAGLGYDHIRLPIDEEQMWDSTGVREKEAFALLGSALIWCKEAKLRVIVDLHILRSHYFLDAKPKLWTDTLEQAKFINFWVQLSEHIKSYSTGMVAYELMNEAVAENPDDWNKLIDKAVTALRKLEPTRTIVIGSNKWQTAGTFKDLQVPANDTNIVLSFHFYTPLVLTHYKASWNKIGEYSGPVTYPGQIIKESDLKGLNKDLVSEIQKFNGTFTIDSLEKEMMMAVEVAGEKKLPLFCGEFGCLPDVPSDARLKWYIDMVTLFKKHGIAYASWDYKGKFGIRDEKTGEEYKDLIKILIGK